MVRVAWTNFHLDERILIILRTNDLRKNKRINRQIFFIPLIRKKKTFDDVSQSERSGIRLKIISTFNIFAFTVQRRSERSVFNALVASRVQRSTIKYFRLFTDLRRVHRCRTLYGIRSQNGLHSFPNEFVRDGNQSNFVFQSNIWLCSKKTDSSHCQTSLYRQANFFNRIINKLWTNVIVKTDKLSKSVSTSSRMIARPYPRPFIPSITVFSWN